MDLRQSNGNTRALGARVEILAGGERPIAWQGVGGGYLSQSELLLHFGLGGATRVDRLIVRWPDGAEQILENLPADRNLKITRDK